MVVELSRTWRFIFSTLQNQPGLATYVGNRIHRGAVPQGSSFPAIIYAMLAPGTDLVALGGDRLWAAPVFKVVAAGETSNGLDLEPIADLIDTALHNASGTTDADGRVFSCIRLRPFELIERTGTGTFQQLGGEYGITVGSA